MYKKTVIPDISWYTKISSIKTLTPRCTFANVQSCPKYYYSLSLLGEAGSTKIDPKEDRKLSKYWDRSKLRPATREQEPEISGFDDDVRSFNKFCPEVLFDRFGFFATYLHRHTDELDIEFAHRDLSKMEAKSNDWRWYWSSCEPLHYSECSLFSLLQEIRNNNSRAGSKNEILEIKPGIFGISINIINLIKRILHFKNYGLLQ